MKTATLQFARLFYGTSRYDVTPSETRPLPETFDFENPEECAKKIFAIMSNAAGGHVLSDCRLSYHLERGSANLSCNGAHVFYAAPKSSPLTTLDQVIAFEKELVRVDLGTVATNQYGDGWKHALWSV